MNTRFFSGTRRRIVLAATAAFLTFAGTHSAHAQFRTSIQGVVTDPSGAVVPGATLTLKDAANNQTIVHTSDSSGVFNFNALPADNFTLTVKHDGFSTRILDNLKLIPEQANSVNVELQVGSISDTVNVDASTSPAVDTQTANIGGTVSANEIQHLPSFNRDVFTLSQLIPGAISDGGQNAGGGVRANPGSQGPGGTNSSGASPTENGVANNANGNQYQNNSISIDGISTVSAVWGGTSIITPTEESIDNVRITTNEYDAENGRFSGAQTMVTTKSGTNQLHGSAFIAIHRPGLNAYNQRPRLADGTYIGAATRDSARYNQYGASLGGPIWRDKVFAFFAYESSPNSSSTQSTGWYETSALRSSTAAAAIAKQYLNFAGAAPIGKVVTDGETCAIVGLVEGTNCRTIAGQGLDIGSPLTIGAGKQDPTATGTAANPGVGSGLDGVADVAFYQTTVPTTSYYRQFAGRADANVTANDRLSFTIYWVPQGNTQYNGGARAYNLFNHDQINQAMSAIWNHTFSPNFLNEARVNVSGWRWNEIGSNPQQPVGLPQANVTFAPSQSLNQFGTSLGSIYKQWTYGFKDVATRVFGPHTLKFGADYTQLRYLSNPIGRPTYGFYNIWTFLNDAPYQEQGGFNSVTGFPGGTRSDERENLFGGFVQDQWRIRPNLTLNYGIRYSYFGALSAKQNNLPYVQLGSGSTTYTGLSVRTGPAAWDPQKGNFGPQFGFNWSPNVLHSNLVVRGGFGLNFNQEEIAITSNTGNNPPTQNYVNYTFSNPTTPGPTGGKILYGISSSPNSLAGYASNPNAITSYNANGLPTAGSANIVIIGDGQRKLPTIYTEHYSLATEYSFNRNFIGSLTYQGSLGRHLISHQNPLAPAVVAGYALNPLVTGGDHWTNVGSSNNNAFIAEAKVPSYHHLNLDAQFMWAKSMDTNGSGPYYQDPYFPTNAAYSYGPSDFNVGKSFKLYGLWQPVFFHGNNLLEKVAGGWSLGGIYNIHTGYPYSPTFGTSQSLYCQICGYYNLRGNYNGQGGNDHSNKSFINGSNFAGLTTGQVAPTKTINGSATNYAYSNKYFTVPDFTNAITWTNAAGFPAGNAALPAPPGMDRNAFVGPRYQNVDASLAKGFGLPKMPLLGEGAKFEIRADVFNLFNLLNLNPTAIASNINASNFGQDTQVLGGRTITFQGRFSF